MNRLVMRVIVVIVLAVVVLGVLEVMPAPVAAQAQNPCGEFGEPVYEEVTECRDGTITIITTLSCCIDLETEVVCRLVGEVDVTPTNEVCGGYAGPMAMIRYTGPAQIKRPVRDLAGALPWAHGAGVALPGAPLRATV